MLKESTPQKEAIIEDYPWHWLSSRESPGRKYLIKSTVATRNSDLIQDLRTQSPYLSCFTANLAQRFLSLADFAK